MIKLGALVVVTLSLFKACGRDEETTVEAPTQTAFAMNASHGGSVVFLNNGWAEVVPKSDGAIEAYVVDTAGAPLATPMTATVSVKVDGDDGGQHTVVLPWNPVSARYEGRLMDARPVAGPIEVTVVAPGRPRWQATAPSVVIVAAPLAPAGSPPVVVVESEREREREQMQIGVRVGPDVIFDGHEAHGHHGRGHHGHGDHHGVIVVGPHGPGVVIAPPHPGHGPRHGGGHRRGRGHH